MRRLVFVMLFLMLTTSAFAVAEDITVSVDTDKIVSAIPIPKGTDGMPAYKSNKEWVQAIIVDYLNQQERRFRASKKAEQAAYAEQIDNTVAVIKTKP